MVKEQRTDTAKFIHRHMNVKKWLNYREQSYTKQELINLALDARDVFKENKEDDKDDKDVINSKVLALATISPPVLVVGDIHGQYADLMRILNTCPNKPAEKKDERPAPNNKRGGFFNNRFVFLGDYVDRGSHSVECISLMFALKVHYPRQYVLLRGNHETRAINFAYGFREELQIKLGEADGHEVWEAFNETFAWMPLACLIGKKILCMHGGISQGMTLEDIKKIPLPLEDVGTNALAQDLLWADPTPDQTIASALPTPQWGKNLVRGLSCTFNPAAVTETVGRLELKLIIRAHQMIPDGFKFAANHQLLTIFSAPRYMNETDNRGAIVRIQENGDFGIIVLKNTKGAGGKNPLNDELTRADDVPNESAKKKSDSAVNVMKLSSSKTKNSPKF
ncbi:hypothetical protein GCK72_014878 [Caenorhabditis remanei]|uniref:Serine/threonine-protein phosphatase n=1 Tax=Caenorhabditis remanei TaxID=31234 RepID=A0A6A5GSL5_CAERE|nr:hypothetical protein GCK72_014878 [Caenorhabditis remanei]KAF1758420.1 hypothetical protein GCK72_014878 [Caenorhabditis remanei]